MYDYFYNTEEKIFEFIRIPAILFKKEPFTKLSSDAKILYALCLQRVSLSEMNQYVDSYNRIYIYFTIENISKSLNCKNQKAVKVLQELEDMDLIEKKKSGIGKPNRLYLKKFF